MQLEEIDKCNIKISYVSYAQGMRERGLRTRSIPATEVTNLYIETIKTRQQQQFMNIKVFQ